MKTLSLIKRRDDLDRTAFRDYYESKHAPLGLTFMTGLVRYVRYHIIDDLVGTVGFDVISSFAYEDARAIEAMLAILESEEGKPLLEDELNFMDKPANTFFPVSERTLTSGEEGMETIFILMNRPAGTSRADYSREFAEREWPRLEGRIDGVEFAVLRDAFPIRPAAGDGPAKEPRYDLVLQVRGGEAGFLAWARDRATQDPEMVVVRTLRHETDLAALQS